MPLRPVTVAAVTPENRRLRLELLDGFQVTMAGQPLALPLGARHLVAFMALHQRWSQRGHIAWTLWTDTTQDRACADLRSALWRVHHFCPGLVEIRDDYLRLAPDVNVDLREAIALAQQILAGDCLCRDSELSALCDAQTVLPGWDDDWVQIERESFRQLRLQALEAACERLAGVGRFAPAIEAGLAAVALEPLRESAHRALIVAHLAQCNQVEAIRQYSSYCALLWDELRIKPSLAIAGLIDTAAVEAAASRSRARSQRELQPHSPRR